MTRLNRPGIASGASAVSRDPRLIARCEGPLQDAGRTRPRHGTVRPASAPPRGHRTRRGLRGRAGRSIDRAARTAAILAVVLAALARPGAVGADPPVWPLEIPSALTSTFGEYRDGYFHAGIDLTTWGEVGLPVRAVDDGQVVRVRASGTGYGRALYVRLDGGGVVVYAHLDRFRDDVAAYVEDVQWSRGRYEVDLFPDEGRFRVRRGEVVAWTGESGAGPPHLHFEVRNDGADVALDPLLRGYEARDARPPRVSEVIVLPARPDVRVAGSPRPLRMKVPPDGGALSVVTTGPVRVEAVVHDLADGKENRLATRSLELLEDGDLRYRALLDRIPYARAREVDLVYDAGPAARGNPRVRRLHPAPGSRLEVHVEGDGVLGRSVGQTPVLVRAADAAGNRTEVAIALTVVDPDTAPPMPGVGAHGSGGSDADVARAIGTPEAWTDVLLLPGRGPAPTSAAVTDPDGVSAPASIHGLDGGWAVSVDPTGLRGALRLDVGDDAIDTGVFAIGPGRDGDLRWPGARLSFDGDAPFADGVVWARPVAAPRGMAEGIRVVSGAVVVGPPGLVLARSARLTLPLTADADTTRVALFKRNGRGEWTYAGRGGGETGFRGADTRRGGRFVLLEDRAAPVVRRLHPRDGRTLTDDRPWIRAGLDDRGTGLHWSGLTLEVDGEPVVAEWDPEAAELRGRPRAGLAPGRHVARVIAVDRVGNETERSWSFTVAGP